MNNVQFHDKALEQLNAIREAIEKMHRMLEDRLGTPSDGLTDPVAQVPSPGEGKTWPRKKKVSKKKASAKGLQNMFAKQPKTQP